jgi:hypothetical protein
MDSATCKAALQLAAQFMTPAKLALYTTALRKQYLTSEIDRVTVLMARKVQPVQEYVALSKSLPILQQQLAGL